MCKPKEKSGLSVHNVVALFKEALLLKWKWRFLEDDKGIWRDILTERYKNLQHFMLKGEVASGLNKAFLW